MAGHTFPATCRDAEEAIREKFEARKKGSSWSDNKFVSALYSTLQDIHSGERNIIANAYGIGIAHIIDKDRPRLDRSTIYRWRNRHLEISNELLNTIYIFVFDKYTDKIILKESETDDVFSQGQFVRNLRNIFGDHSVGKDHHGRYKGRYIIYRPCFLNPYDSVIVGQLDITPGISSRPEISGDFDIVIRYAYKRVTEKDELLTGVIVPFGNAASAFLKSKSDGRFIVHIDRRDDDYMMGIIIADSNTAAQDRASSWPFYAERTDEEVPRTLQIPLAAAPSRVQKELSRGAIHWDPTDYPLHSRRPIS